MSSHKMELPAEGLLALMAIFLIMPVMFFIVNSPTKPPEPIKASTELPTPTPEAEEEAYRVY